MTSDERAARGDPDGGQSSRVDQSAEVTPRVLVRIIIFEPDSADVADIGYEAQHPNGILPVEDHYRIDAIGYAEFEPYAQITRESDFEAFKQVVEERSEYVHWKPVMEVDSE